MSPPPDICDRCKFYTAIDKGGTGRCRRFPPPFPEIGSHTWCGEHRPLKSPEIQIIDEPDDADDRLTEVEAQIHLLHEVITPFSAFEALRNDVGGLKESISAVRQRAAHMDRVDDNTKKLTALEKVVEAFRQRTCSLETQAERARRNHDALDNHVRNNTDGEIRDLKDHVAHIREFKKVVLAMGKVFVAIADSGLKPAYPWGESDMLKTIRAFVEMYK